MMTGFSRLAWRDAFELNTPKRRELIREQILWAGILAVYFVAVYMATNVITAYRAALGLHVPTFWFAWERKIPFVAALIGPYMSMDVLYMAAPFLCTSIHELRTHGKRIVLATTVAGLCFLFLPLRFGFDRPATAGIWGSLFAMLYGFDRPYNLAPSLHVVYWFILFPLYMRHTRGALRWTAVVWFALILASPVLVYQHHFIDVVSGMALGILCIYVVSDEPAERNALMIRNGRAATLYSVGAIALAVLAMVISSWGWLLVWPALALGILAAGYWGLGPEVFRKTDGRLPLASRCVLLPYFAGAAAAHWLQVKRCPQDFAEVAPNLIVGRRVSRHEVMKLTEAGAVAVLDLTAEFSEPAGLRQLAYLNVPVLDLTAPSQAQMRAGISFIREHVPRGKVYVHCALGYSRSACVVAAYLIAEGLAKNAEDARAILEKSRTRVILRPRAMAALREFQDALSTNS